MPGKTIIEWKKLTILMSCTRQAFEIQDANYIGLPKYICGSGNV